MLAKKKKKVCFATYSNVIEFILIEVFRIVKKKLMDVYITQAFWTV